MTDVAFGLFNGPIFEREDKRGTFSELVNTGTWESLVHCRMKTGAVMGNHYHDHTIVLIYLLEGAAEVKTVDVRSGEARETPVKASQGYVFRPEEARVIRYLQESTVLLMKSHRYDPDDPDLIDYDVP